MENATDKDDDYEIMPHREILELKKELEKLKRNPFGKNRSAEDLLDAINNLDHSITRLIDVFEHAADKLSEEIKPKENLQVQNDMKPIMNKIDLLVDQNKELAEGLISVVQMIRKEKRDVPKGIDEQIRPMVSRKPETRVFVQQSEPKPAPMLQPMAQPSLNPMPNYPRQSFNDIGPSPYPQPSQRPSFSDMSLPPMQQSAPQSNLFSQQAQRPNFQEMSPQPMSQTFPGASPPNPFSQAQRPNFQEMSPQPMPSAQDFPMGMPPPPPKLGEPTSEKRKGFLPF
jgi:hypothetical protein